jgi:6-pyruvoyltetrahydropterin/6-carboxytetrahydropterin synthase
MYTVTKEFSFDSAHRLVDGYQGKCSNVHGHTWKVRFTISGDKLDGHGFLRDFGDFKPLKEFIDNHLDHALLLNENDGTLLTFCREHNQKHYMFKGNPTSECLAEYLFRVARDHCLLWVSAVEVDETCTCSARYSA